MATLKEIARAAGVSTATVSNVINGNYKRVSEETVAQIQALIRQAGYVPNQAARSLAQRESRFIAIIVQASPDENIFLNPYNATYVGALIVNLYKKGYYPLIRFTDDFGAVEQDIRGWNVAGALFNGSYSRYLENLESLAFIPSVFTDCYFDLPGVNHVRLDDEAGGRIAGDYLYRMGHRRAAFVAMALEDSDVDKRRLVGFRDALGRHGLTVPDQWVFPSADFEAQRERLAALLGSPDGPTAFFCSADQIALHLIDFMRSVGLSVPGDISVMGFDNLPMASVSVPKLTTVAQDIDQKALVSVDTLVRHIQNKDLSPEKVILGVSLVERESVKQLG